MREVARITRENSINNVGVAGEYMKGRSVPLLERREIMKEHLTRAVAVHGENEPPIGVLFDYCRRQGIECIVLLAKGDEINSAQMSMSLVSSSMRRSISMLSDPPF